jgi:hypothetical protein
MYTSGVWAVAARDRRLLPGRSSEYFLPGCVEITCPQSEEKTAFINYPIEFQLIESKARMDREMLQKCYKRQSNWSICT